MPISKPVPDAHIRCALPDGAVGDHLIISARISASVLCAHSETQPPARVVMGGRSLSDSAEAVMYKRRRDPRTARNTYAKNHRPQRRTRDYWCTWLSSHLLPRPPFRGGARRTAFGRARGSFTYSRNQCTNGGHAVRVCGVAQDGPMAVTNIPGKSGRRALAAATRGAAKCHLTPCALSRA